MLSITSPPIRPGVHREVHRLRVVQFTTQLHTQDSENKVAGRVETELWPSGLRSSVTMGHQRKEVEHSGVGIG